MKFLNARSIFRQVAFYAVPVARSILSEPKGWTGVFVAYERLDWCLCGLGKAGLVSVWSMRGWAGVCVVYERLNWCLCGL